MDEYSNSELEEMGIPLPCDCRFTYIESDEQDRAYSVCVDCGSGVHVGRMKEGAAW